MADPGNRLADLLLRFAPSLVGLRRVPVLGDFLSWTSRKLVPGDSLVWVRIQRGPSKGLWIRVNPRTGQDVRQGIGEPQVQKALVEHLRPGMTSDDFCATLGLVEHISARLVASQS